MAKHYFSCEESEAYKDGYRDSERGRRDYFRDKHAMDGVDRAYFDGREDQERQERQREEERETERQQEEAEMRRQQQRMRDEEYNRYLQMQIDDQMETERSYHEAMANEMSPVNELQPDEMSPKEYAELNATPCTEEELFHRILEDERNESE